MKRRIKAAVLALGLVLSAGAQAIVDEFAIGFSPRTGDTWVDARLGDINVFARGNTDGFIDDVVVSYGAPRALVREYYVDRRWAPGDIYYACAIAYQLRRPCQDVLRIYERDHGQGWGAIAKRLGIKPGSAEFHALKGGVGQGHERMRARGGPKAGNGPGKGRDAGPSPARGGKPQQGGDGKDKGKGKGRGNG